MIIPSTLGLLPESPRVNFPEAGRIVKEKSWETNRSRDLLIRTPPFPPCPTGALRHLIIFLDQRIDWLPAMIVRGEGIFVEFDRDRLDAWIKRTSVIRERIEQLNSNYNVRRSTQGQSPRLISPQFVLLHTFAHVVINQLAYECGYGSASLRERLYCGPGDGNDPMCGVLIYTASGDSEGSMGGLVRQACQGTFENIVIRAIQRAGWCSSDPVCIESNGQGSENCNLATCHGCYLLPETSCEEGNRLLDRALLVGRPGEPYIGFFSTLM
jgi:hypothetical protein